MEKKFMRPLKNAVLLISFMLGFQESVVAKVDSIVLPPKPDEQKNKTLLGVDANNNNVRDDLEHYIYEKVTKDVVLFRAFLKFAESQSTPLKVYPNSKLLSGHIQLNALDGQCIHSLEPEGFDSDRHMAIIVLKIFNTDERKKVLNWSFKFTSGENVKTNKKAVCR